MATIADTIANLDKARTLVLSDAVYYKDIVPAILPSIGPSAQLDLRRWGAEFLAEAFAAPKFAQDKKQEVAVLALETLKGLLELQPEDTGTVKSVVQASSSIYPLIFRHTISNPNDATTWQKMAAIKTNILRRMDNASPGVRICCIKFVQRVVQTQTPGLIADPRRPEQNDISIALVPRDHPLIPPKNLEPEASGLLDRLLGILQDNDSTALLVDATLCSLGVLVRARPSISPKIVSAVLNFNPFRQADLPMTLRLKLEIRSMERTAKCFSTSILKMPKIPQHLQGQTAQRLEQHVQRLQQMRQELDGGGNRKRAAPAEPTDGLDQAKRQRLGAQIATPAQPGPFPPLPQGPISIAQLFTLTQDAGAKSFDVQQLPIDLVVRILVPIIGAIDKTKLDNAVNAVRARYLSLPTTQPASALRAATVATGLTKAGGDEEDDDYEPDYEPTEDANQIMNKLDSTSSPTMLPEAPPEVALGPFRLPTPPPMSEQEIEECGKHMVRRIFATMTDLEEKPSTKTKQTGFNRLAASNHDRDAWVTIISRLATRASAGLEDAGAPIKSEEEHGGNVSKKPFSLSNMIRDSLYLYVVEDFRRRLGVAISWLNEEWYNDRIQALQHDGASEPAPPQHYETWALKVLDGIMPYIDANDKSRVIQFLSEIPVVSQEMLDRIKKLAGDPERVALTTQALLYLVMFKPPAREIAVDALEDLWRNNAEARPSAGKMLKKWRPKVLEEANSSKPPDIKGEGS